MRSRLLPVILCLPLYGAAPAETKPDPVSYQLTAEMADGALTGLKVQVRFRADTTGITNFGWGDGWAGERKLWQWARNFHVDGATSVQQIGDGHWRIVAPSGRELTASYRVISAYDHDPTVEDSEQPKPVIRPDWFYAVGNALFAFPDGREAAPAKFDWARAPGIGFASDLEHMAGSSRAPLRSGTVSDILESIVIGGKNLQTFPAADGSGVRVATLGQFSFEPEQLAHLARQVIAAERDFWKSDHGAPFLVTVAPTAGSPGSMSFGGTGRGDGFALWIDQRVPLDRMKWLLAHEYFHAWNPDRLGTMSEERTSRLADFWFSEGFTDYYARALMVRAGLISPTDFIAQWNEALAAYAASPVRNSSNDEMVSNFWNDEEIQKIPYQRGALLAAMWNARLLARTKGNTNLDVILHEQFLANRLPKGRAVEEFASLAHRHGLNIASDHQRYLMRGETITLATDTFGPCATVTSERRPIFSRGFDANATALAGNIVTGVDPLLLAYAAGLRNGMKIISRLEGEPDNSLAPYALLIEDRGKQRVIKYLPQGSGEVSVQQVKLHTTADKACPLSLSGVSRSSSTAP